MARILLIDDDPALLDMLSLLLEEAGHEVVAAPDGLQGWERLRAAAGGAGPELVVSDVNMPRLDGFALLRRIRERDAALPVILLTSRDSEIDEALGLELGADDYIQKPFSSRVLLARIGALLRRQAARQEAEVELRAVGHLSLDAERVLVRWKGDAIEVTVSEFRLLDTLTRRPGVVLSRARLMEGMRGDDSVVDERIIDTYVRRLRRKFEAISADFDRIDTVIGAGYRWKDGGGAR